MLDFETAYPSVSRPQLYTFLHEQGIQGQMLAILKNFTSSNFDFLHYIITVFVHFHFGIQGESQVFEMVNFADHFVVRVGESSLGDPGSLAPL